MSTRRALLPLVLAALAGLACNALAPATATPPPTPTLAVATASATARPSETAAVDPPTPTPSGSPVPPATATPVPLAGDPLPRLAAGTAVDILRVNMADATRGWAVGRAEGDLNDHILRTADGGVTWQDVTPPEPEGDAGAGRAAVAYFAGDNAWAAYYDRDFSLAEAAYVWRTSDAGATWAYGSPLDLSDMEFFTLSDLHFAGREAGWLLAHVGAGMNHDYVVMFHSRDAGAIWERTVDPFDIREDNLQMSCYKTGVGALSALTLWVTGDCQGVAPGYFLQRSDDGGVTWRLETLPPPAGMPNAFERQDGSCGTYRPTVIDSSTPEVLLVLTCNFYEDTLVTAHHLYSTSDGGSTWQTRPLPAPITTWLNRQEGWAVNALDPNNPGLLRPLYHTTDGGATWTEINTVAWSADLDFTSSTLGWAVAQSGGESALVRSDDGGASWDVVEAVIGP
jgi:photosystem II stability/assembly factor-like uncharacterized protein